MKTTIIVINFVMVSSFAYGGPGMFRMGFGSCNEIAAYCSTYIARRFHSIPSSDSIKKISTQGYRPTEPVKLEFQYDNMPQQRIKFLDGSCERYVRVHQQSRKCLRGKRIVFKEQIDSNTLVVDFKK